MKRWYFTFALAAAAELCSIPASAYYHFVYYLSSGNAPAKFDLTALPNNTVWFFVSEAGPTSFSTDDNFASVVGQIRQATQIWNGVSSSALRVGFGGFENANTQQNTPAADVVFEDLAPGVLGLGGPTILSTAITPVNGTAPPDTGVPTPGVPHSSQSARGSMARTSSSAASAAPFVPIARSAIHLNLNALAAPFPSYDEAFLLVVVHEMGHALGLQHTFTSAAMSQATTSATSQANPIDVDDIAGISTLYPNANFAQTGTITGQITSGGNGVHLESVVAIRSGASAVSALTNPDGTYEIDGVPPGQYFVYAHALPPDANIAGPWNADGSVAAASGPTNALFYPGTMSVEQATPIDVGVGATVAGVNISVASLPVLPIYDVGVYGYYANDTVAIKPAFLNIGAGEAVVAASGVGLGSNGKAPGLNAAFVGSSAIVASNGVQPYQSGGNTYIALDVVFTPFSSTGPQHLIFTTPGFIHVLPSAVRLTEEDPPSIQSVVANGDGTLTITGTNWAAGSAIYFDGLPAQLNSLSVNAKNAGTAIVTPPPGASGQTAILTVYNPDGQNSQFVQSANPATYMYANAAAQTISSISPASLPAGAEAMVDITGSGFNFVAGQTTVGFGTSDVAVNQVFVLGPNHLQADVSVAPGAALSNPDVSVFSGFQMVTAKAGFQITPAMAGLPAPIPTLTNALPGLTGSYAGAVVGLYGSNLAAGNAVPSVTFNGEAAVLLYSSPTQINLQIPSDIPAGAALMQLNNGVMNAYPLTVAISPQPANITSVVDASGNAISQAFPAAQGDLLTVSLTGFAPDGITIATSRVQVGVGGLMHSVLTVSQPSSGIYQVSFLLNPNEPTGPAQPLIVYLDGNSSYPVTIPITTPSGSFTIPTSSASGN